MQSLCTSGDSLSLCAQIDMNLLVVLSSLLFIDSVLPAPAPAPAPAAETGTQIMYRVKGCQLAGKKHSFAVKAVILSFSCFLQKSPQSRSFVQISLWNPNTSRILTQASLAYDVQHRSVLWITATTSLVRSMSLRRMQVSRSVFDNTCLHRLFA